MPVVIDPLVKSLAQGVAANTGLDVNVILAQWYAEQGKNGTLSVQNWPGNNPAGIRPGNPYVDALRVGVSPQGFDIFPTPVAGAQAYSLLINRDPNYSIVRSAIATKNPKAQLDALISSPWDSGHYTAQTRGDKLYGAYQAVTGAVVGNTPGDPFHQDTLAQQATQSNIANTIMSWLGLSQFNFWQLLVVVLGSIGILIVLVNMAKSVRSEG